MTSEKKRIVFSLGGSLVVPEEIDVPFLASFKAFVEASVSQGEKFMIVVGGGRTCRKYQQAAREVADVSKEDLNWIGIYSLRLNAELIRHIFENLAHGAVVNHPDEISADVSAPIIIGGAHTPGTSSDFNAVEFAEKAGARQIVNLSNIDYVYTKDPKKFPDAEKIEGISWSEYRKLIPTEHDPGLNTPFDPIASKKAQELGLEVAIMNGKDLDNLRNYLVGAAFRGTVIHA